MRVLVVEDDSMVAELFRYVLSQKGHDVQCWVTDFDAMREGASWHDFDVIVCDQQLGEYDGKALFAWLSQQQPQLRRIMITGSSSTSEQQASADKVLIKPVTAEMLLNVVQS